MTTRKWLVPLLLSLPLAAVILFVGACFPVGLGDPETSKVDPKLCGTWVDVDEDGEGTTAIVLLPFDGRAYVMRVVEFERTDQGVTLRPPEALYKAWLTTIEGVTFLTAQPLYPRDAVPVDKTPGYIVAALKLSDDGKSIEAHGVNPSFEALATLKTMPGSSEYEKPPEGTKPPTEEEARALLRKVITANAKNKELYIEDIARYRRTTDKVLLDALFEGLK